MAPKRRAPVQQYGERLSNTLVYIPQAMLKSRDQLVREVEAGTAQDCFASHIYEHRKEYGLNDTEAMFAGNIP